jgi:hypothetical protein
MLLQQLLKQFGNLPVLHMLEIRHIITEIQTGCYFGR